MGLAMLESTRSLLRGTQCPAQVFLLQRLLGDPEHSAVSLPWASFSGRDKFGRIRGWALTAREVFGTGIVLLRGCRERWLAGVIRRNIERCRTLSLSRKWNFKSRSSRKNGKLKTSRKLGIDRWRL